MQSADQQLVELEREHREILAGLDHVDGDDALHSLMQQAYDVRDRALQQAPETMAGAAALARIARQASEEPDSLEVQALESVLATAPLPSS